MQHVQNFQTPRIKVFTVDNMNSYEMLFQNYYNRIRSSYDMMSRVVRKPAFCICENKDPDQLRGNREADQCLCFRYIDSTIPQLPKYKISSL